MLHDKESEFWCYLAGEKMRAAASFIQGFGFLVRLRYSFLKAYCTFFRFKFKDFFLIPQSVNQGTVTPTHFVVIKESAALPADAVQKLAYKLTHMYYNWPGTVRVPAPCQYAHKLVDLVGEHLHATPSPELNRKLYYL